MTSASKIGRLITGMALLTLLASSVQSQSAASIEGVYSDLHYIEGAGDLLGTELKIAKDGNTYKGFLQIAEGEPSKVMPVNIEVKGSEIRFSISEDTDYAGEFVGKIGLQFLTGEFRFKGGGTNKVKLRRGKSYWDRSHN
jgi:hypothetical protein